MGNCKSKHAISIDTDSVAAVELNGPETPQRTTASRVPLTSSSARTARKSNVTKGSKVKTRSASRSPSPARQIIKPSRKKETTSHLQSTQDSREGKPSSLTQRGRSSSDGSKHKEKGGSVMPRLSFNKKSDKKSSEKGPDASAAEGSSSNDFKSSVGAQHERPDPQWISLFEDARSRIVDPADLLSVIEERLADTINLLGPAEIVFIQRRSRSIMRSILASSSSSGSSNSTMNAMMGKFSIGSSAVVDDDGKSRIVCQKENVMDENLFRKVFDGAGRYLKAGFEGNVPTMSREAHRKRRGRSGNDPYSSMGDFTGMENGGEESLLAVLGTQTTSPPEITSGNNFSHMSPGRGNKQYNGVNGKKNGKHSQKGESNSQSLADPIGAAYILLLHLSEGQREYAAAVADVSSKCAGLNMDVNHLIKEEENGSAAAKQPSVVPPPPPAVPSAEAYGSDELSAVPPPPNASGISFETLCFIIAMALRGTRQQRLVLLFYLLVPPSQLKSFLDLHPGGGIPSWILEIGTDTILSYASLAHYYYYDDMEASSMDGNHRKNTAEISAQSEWTGKPHQPRRHGINPNNAIDTISILLTESTGNDFGKSGNSVSKESTPTKPSSKNLGKNNGVAGCGDLVECLRLAREGKIDFSEDAILNDSKGSMDRLWDASSSFYVAENDVDSEKKKSAVMEQSWCLADFISWADLALNNTDLDAIMFRLFGKGILPDPRMELFLVEKRWLDWQQIEHMDEDESVMGFSSNMQKPLSLTEKGEVDPRNSLHKSCAVWGGMVGIDGKGGLGYGLMAVMDKKWWEKWISYSGWKWDSAVFDNYGAPFMTSNSLGGVVKRPHELSTECLLDRASDSFVPGTFGSYEVMKSDLKENSDYILVPCRVWDILYELYGGGPMLIRMVSPPSDNYPDMNGVKNLSIEVVASSSTMGIAEEPITIPRGLQVVTHPWIIHCHLCDPHQPYRRGDAGPLSIRVMTMPDQPLWRLFAEIVLRLPVHYGRAKDNSGYGKARLWKRIDPATLKDSSPGACRYGPWSLLCKSRFAKFPVKDGNPDEVDYVKEFQDDWQTYADHGSVESVGLSDESKLMFEFAILGKGGGFAWPREAAAKAGRMRRVADEDAAFRLALRGIENGKVVSGPSQLIGKKVDALDSSGRWYQAQIMQVERGSQVFDDDEDSVTEPDDVDESKPIQGENRLVRVDFSDQLGHEEWIQVNSDRLAVAGRFTTDSMKDANADSTTNDGNSNNPTQNDTKPRLPVPGRKSRDASSHETTTVETSIGAVCTFPGYGACGLSNLGNTCYANSALQCISYMPLLRSYLLSGQYKTNGDLNKDNPLGTGGRLLEEFSDLLRIMWSGKYGSRAPTRFRSQLGKARSQYSGADQQDAQELLNDMLDVLHEDSNKVKKKPYVEALEDDWVKKNHLPRVGQEAWRRFLRRNRSIIANVAMGQVLNRVTCPVCHHSSTNFDPFNMLSIPFPTVAEVVFRCTVIRRGTALNCKGTLRPNGRNGKSEKEKNMDMEPSPPSTKLIFEQYVIAMSRLADIGDLKLRIQNISGIPVNRLKLCKSEEIVVNNDIDKSFPTRTYVKVSALPDKEGPCVQLAKPSTGPEDLSTPAVAPTQIVAFESTLHPRPPRGASNKICQTNACTRGHTHDESSREDSSTAEEDEDDDDIPENGGSKRTLMENLGLYGDDQECVLYDTDPTPLSKAMSRSLWPKSSSEFKLGLRVDAIDHRDHWFPGSVVEIIEGVDDSGEDDESMRDIPPVETKVRIHFDNFSSKWDETYSIDQFKRGQVRPLYSHANPRAKPTEFMVHNRHFNRAIKGNALFGQAYYLQCQNEWSTARAGAHILAQASRFLQTPRKMDKSSSKNEEDKRREDSNLKRFYQSIEEAKTVLAEVIQILIESDRDYVEAAISNGGDITEERWTHSNRSRQQRSVNSSQVFNASQMSTTLSKRLSTLLPHLPFEVRVCTADSPLGAPQGGVSDEVIFPYSLVRTIGNYMNARHAVVLHWKDKSPGRTSSKKTSSSEYTILYSPPVASVHKQSRALLNGSKGGEASKNGQGKNNAVHGGMHLGVCLTEFCKEQHLPATDCWRCPRCKDVREGKQCMTMWRLPDLLTFHVKRFNCSARWREKITTKVNFPLTGLDMSEWCDKESPAMQGPDGSCVYDLYGVVNHYGGMTGGHYVATCKATVCSPDGSEELGYNFNGTCNGESGAGVETVQSGWRLGRNKDKESTTSQAKLIAAASARAAAESPEPLWLQFDDDLVEPIPPKNVVSEMAYVLFYRRRRISSSNIAKYSTLE